MKFAIIDLGTNSVRFDIYNLNDKKEKVKIKLIYREKQMIRLGQGLFEMGQFHPQAKARALEVLAHFHELLVSNDIDVVSAFATSAMRSASDSAELIQKIRSKTGIDIHIIDGKVEAELIAQGILHNENLPNKPFVIVDIGGGSTEICFCSEKKLLEGFSFPLGASRFQQTFLHASPPQTTPGYENPVEDLRQYIRDTMTPILKKRSFPRPELVIGSSGTILAICRILKQNGESVDPFQKNSVRKYVEKMIPLTLQELANISGMEEKRLDIIVAGAILFDEILEVLGVEKIRTTKFALRDGILLEELEKLSKSANSFSPD